MKKLFFLVLMIINFTSIQSQTNQIDSLPVSETERLIDKYSDKVVNGFNSVVTSVTPSIKEGFKIAVNKNIAYGIACLLPIIFFFIFLYLLLKEYNRISNILISGEIPSFMNKKFGIFSDENASALLIIYLLFTIVLFLLSAVFTGKGLTHLISPEWYAIKDLIDLIK